MAKPLGPRKNFRHTPYRSHGILGTAPLHKHRCGTCRYLLLHNCIRDPELPLRDADLLQSVCNGWAPQDKGLLKPASTRDGFTVPTPVRIRARITKGFQGPGDTPLNAGYDTKHDRDWDLWRRILPTPLEGLYMGWTHRGINPRVCLYQIAIAPEYTHRKMRIFYALPKDVERMSQQSGSIHDSMVEFMMARLRKPDTQHEGVSARD